MNSQQQRRPCTAQQARAEAEGGWHVAEQGRGGWLRMRLWMRLRIRLCRAGVRRQSCACAGSRVRAQAVVRVRRQ
jgi:hypothetical protein